MFRRFAPGTLEGIGSMLAIALSLLFGLAAFAAPRRRSAFSVGRRARASARRLILAELATSGPRQRGRRLAVGALRPMRRCSLPLDPARSGRRRAASAPGRRRRSRPASTTARSAARQTPARPARSLRAGCCAGAGSSVQLSVARFEIISTAIAHQPRGDQQRMAEDRLAAGDPQVHRQERQPRPDRRRHAGQEPDRLVRLLLDVDLRVEPREPQRAADREGEAANQPKRGRSCSDHRNITSAGAMPKLSESARLSSSAPNRDCALSSRAMRPSIPSSTPARMIANSAISQSPSIAKRMPVRPEHSAAAVIALGSTARSVSPLPAAGRASSALVLARLGPEPRRSRRQRQVVVGRGAVTG